MRATDSSRQCTAIHLQQPDRESYGRKLDRPQLRMRVVEPQDMYGDEFVI